MQKHIVSLTTNITIFNMLLILEQVNIKNMCQKKLYNVYKSNEDNIFQ